MSPPVIYTLRTTYPNHPLISKDNIECVLQCNKSPKKKNDGYILQTNCSSIKQQYMKLEVT